MPDLKEILAGEPKYRLKQIYQAWFDPSIKSYGEITTLSKSIRENLKNIPWLSVTLKKMVESELDGTKKALLELADGELVETVLMERKDRSASQTRGNRFTVCLSAQVGCPMACKFCATGASGFKRNLAMEEIIDQLRFWQGYLGDAKSVGNIVLMGQGEPLLNYENVRDALNIILENTEIGQSKITLSTVGIPAAMDKLLEDKNFPSVRFALSVHSALDNTRKRLIPSHQRGFFGFFTDWAKRYHERFNSRAHFIGLEYAMLLGVNDDEAHFKAFLGFASNLGRVRVNLIPYNSGTECGVDFKSSSMERVKSWQKKLMDEGFVCTIRESQGQDIAAACGQLAGGRS